MATILQKERTRFNAAAKKNGNNSNPIKTFQIVDTNYKSQPVDIRDDFLAPLEDPSVIKVEKVDFASGELPEFKKLYAVVLDNILSKQECDQLIHLAELSAGGHGEAKILDNGWKPAMVNAGVGCEFYAPQYRNSDRIIWDNNVLVERLWNRIRQGKGIKEYLSALDGPDYAPVLGYGATKRGERWVPTKQGINERMRFLKYGAGQFFRRHCDGVFETADRSQRSFYTVQLYLNDSAQALGMDTPKRRQAAIAYESKEKQRGKLLFGGATTFHSPDNSDKSMDIDPSQNSLLHSGADVVAGEKYTMRSDIMYEFESGKDKSAGIVFH
ncbi:hypothetical protein D0Z07_9172 [Hyphodiscus hymeniophilus]|uniref:Prolyl 4-hydroxylase alpha subunit domain-containing protein n=1 Tax=Hyphodiscus hymeniophilus TaxID=353542 RepID=A0A9P6SL68_9HELO|nr:hypothetical protein D0Z07_9172 [Hyphodiscus hymeniophilus]